MSKRCNIIRDILPLYAEKMTCADTDAYVEEHLQMCEACRRELAMLLEPKEPEFAGDVSSGETAIKAIRKKWNRKNAALAILILLMLVSIGGYLTVLCHRPFLVAMPASGEDVAVKTYMEPCEDVYGNRKFRIEFSHKKGKALQVSMTDDYAVDETDRRIRTGYTLEIRETVLDFYGTARYQDSIGTGYVYNGEKPPEGFDFTITVKYKDRTDVYSMAEEGMFAP